MAKVNIESRKTKKMVEQEVEVETVVLEMSMEEAECLRAILGKVGGDPLGSRRKLIDNIFVALENKGIRYHVSDMDGSIYFV